MSAVPPSPRAGDEWPMVGREHELAMTVAALRDDRPGAVILGPGGSGRSRLMREALAGAVAEGAHVETVQATRSAATVPLGALVKLLPSGAVEDDPSARMRVCAQALAGRAHGARFVLGVDDAELLDPPSAALLLALVRSAEITILATVRTGRPCPDAVVALHKDAGARCVELTRLDEATSRGLLEAIVDGPVDRAAASRAATVTGGDVVYLSELARAAVASGALVRRGDLWTIVREPEANAALRQIVDAELAELGTDERELVELLALGERLDLVQIDALRLGEAAAGAQARGIVRSADATVALTRPLLGVIVRERLSGPRAGALRRRLLEVTAHRDDPPSDAEALRLARLRLEAGVTPAPALLLGAARGAVVAGELDQAAELAQLALDQERSLAAAHVLARARRLRGRAREAEAVLASVEDLAPGDDNASAYAAEWLGTLFWDLRRPQEVTALLERMGHWSATEDWRAFVDRLRVTFGGVAEGQGDIGAAQRIATDSRLPERTRRMSAAAWGLSLLLAGDGQRAARETFSRLPQVHAGDDDELAELATFAFVSIESGWRWDLLEEHLQTVVEQASRARVRAAVGIAALNLARLRFQRGELHDASRWLMEAEVHLSRRDPFNTMIRVRCLTVAVAALAGDYDGAQLAHAALQSAIAVREPLANQRPAVAWATARLEAMRTPARAARRLLDDGAAVAAEMPGLAPALAYEALRIGDPAAPGAVVRLVAGCRTPLASACGAHAEARTAGGGATLLAVVEEMSRLGARRYAAEIAGEAAEAFLGEGREDSARRAAARARELHADGQGAPAPVIDGLDGPAIELTPREAQVVALARDGLSNAEIAQRLVISVRTAETHLYRGMRKLGVSDRRDL